MGIIFNTVLLLLILAIILFPTIAFITLLFKFKRVVSLSRFLLLSVAALMVLFLTISKIAGIAIPIIYRENMQLFETFLTYSSVTSSIAMYLLISSVAILLFLLRRDLIEARRRSR